MIHKQQIEDFAMLAVRKQLELANLPESILKEPEWYSNYTITTEKYDEWEKWFVQEARRVFKLNKKEATREFSYFNLNYGLRIQD